MAGTQAGRALTEAHRADQTAIASRLAADTAAAWRLLDLGRLDAATPGWLAVMLALVGAHCAASARTAADYYAAYRAAELTRPERHPVPAPSLDLARRARPDRERTATSLVVCGPVAVKAATARRVAQPDAARVALARVTGAATRHTLDGGRAVLVDAVRNDRTAIGWIRVTDAHPCAFCAMLAARGPAYTSARSALLTETGTAFHDGCACTVEPVYDRSAAWPGRGAEFARLWRQATRGLSGNDARRAFRRAIDAQRPPTQAEPEPQPDADRVNGLRNTERNPSAPTTSPGAPGLTDAQLEALTDHDLAEAFADASSTEPIDEALLDRLLAQMDRRDATAATPVDPLAGVDLATLPDFALFDLWREHAGTPTAVERVAAELDRRDRTRGELLDAPNPDTAPDDDLAAADTVAQLDADLDAAAATRAAADAERRAQAEREARIDALVARGWDYAEAYAEVHQLDAAQLRRQERAAAVDVQRRTGETRDQAVRRLYAEWVYLQWLAAEEATNGFLLNAGGRAAGIDPRELWGGNVARARRYASEELKRWWQDHPRKTLTEFRAELLGRDRDLQAAQRARGRGNDRDFGL